MRTQTSIRDDEFVRIVFMEKTCLDQSIKYCSIENLYFINKFQKKKEIVGSEDR